MKALRIILIGLVLGFAGAAQAQVSVNVNFGSPPQWGPAGYTEVRYYYLPDVEAFYDIQTSMFIYYGGGVWVHRAYLPHRYRNYDLYGGYKVVMIDYHGNSPYVHYTEYHKKYGKGYRGHEQKNIGERPGHDNSGKHYSSGQHSNKNNSQKHNNNSGKSHDNKNDKGHKGGKDKKHK